jgi:hypothetical protein
MLLAIASLALATPARCVATWTGPVPGCALRGEIVASAAGPNEKAAERALRRQLERVTELSVAAQRTKRATQVDEAFSMCADTVPTRAFVNCFAEPALAAPALCFVELPDPTCWTGEVLQIDAVGWQAVGTGRDAMCKAVDARLVAQNYTDLEARRAVCAASCASKTTVRCPTGR